MKLVYEAENGKQFDTAEECQAYEAGPDMMYHSICKYLNMHDDLRGYELTCHEVVTALLQAYDIVPKAKP